MSRLTQILSEDVAFFQGRSQGCSFRWLLLAAVGGELSLPRSRGVGLHPVMVLAATANANEPLHDVKDFPIAVMKVINALILPPPSCQGS